jgi:two-component sensor histidine kinase
MVDGLLKNMKKKALVNQVNLSLLIDVIHKFSQDIISAKTEEEVFKILANEVSQQMDFLDCVIYKVDNHKKILRQVAAYGPSKITNSGFENPLELKFGQGHAGKVAQTGQTLLVDDVTTSKDYFLDVVQAGSELIVPVKIDNVVYAVITSEHPDKYFYKENHKKLLEVITSIAVGALVKIHEAEELGMVKEKLEVVLERKSSDLDMAIETLSTQYSKLKYQHDKQESLFQEVHHRVTNNLQIISSILRLYMNQDDPKSINSLQEVHNRVQAMALIYQNIYKSMEVNMVNINSYLYDLINYLKSSSSGKTVFIEVDVEFDHFGLDVLVPLGLYITEVYYYWLKQLGETNEINLRIKLLKDKGDFSFCFIMEDDEAKPFKEKLDLIESEDVSSTLISALIEQLEGKFTQGFQDGNFMRLRFNA